MLPNQQGRDSATTESRDTALPASGPLSPWGTGEGLAALGCL